MRYIDKLCVTVQEKLIVCVNWHGNVHFLLGDLLRGFDTLVIFIPDPYIIMADCDINLGYF